jgi:plasmid stabilization system protein ParE
MEIRWSLPAAEDLERICAWIERDNPEAARRKSIRALLAPNLDFAAAARNVRTESADGHPAIRGLSCH